MPPLSQRHGKGGARVARTVRAGHTIEGEFDHPCTAGDTPTGQPHGQIACTVAR